MMDINIIYEDRDIIIVEKPAGIESQAGRGFEPDMLSYLKNYRLSKKEDTYIGLIHRLDKPVTGIMVFGKSESATSGLNRQFVEHSIVKKYSTILCGQMVEKCGKLIDYIAKDGKNKIAKVSNEKDKLAKRASLNYKVLKEYKLYGNKLGELVPENNSIEKSNRDIREERLLDIFSLVDIELETGRFHQIRIQFSARGKSILGDRKYANNISYNMNICNILSIKNICLKSYYLEFTHPGTKKRMKFEIDKEFNFCE